jgi:Ca-activated chloride channel family protein
MYELQLEPNAGTEGLATVRIRAKPSRGQPASEWAFPLRASAIAPSFDAASADFRFATAVMGGAEKFRQSPFARTWDMEQILRIARRAAQDQDERLEFVQLLERARPVVGAVAARE